MQAGFGRVVFFAGGGAACAYPLFSDCALSKVSTVRLVENLAVEYPPSTGFSFVALAPGAVATPMLSKVEADGGPNATHYINPILFRESINAIEISKNWLKSILPKSLIALISRTQVLFLRRYRQTVKRASLLKSSETLIDKEYPHLYFECNPNGVFLRLFACKK